MIDQNFINGDSFEFSLPKIGGKQIKILGIGGCGNNALNAIHRMGITDADLIVANTDAEVLGKSPVIRKIQLGMELTNGMGATSPDIGREAAAESIDELCDLVESRTQIVVLIAGMGGGTGTGATPVVAEFLRSHNILTVALVTFPFEFEGESRRDVAIEGIVELKKSVDSILVVRNSALTELHGDLGFKKAFEKSDQVLYKAVKCITQITVNDYYANIDFSDLRSILKEAGSTIMGGATASGVQRAQDAVREVTCSPLLAQNDLRGCKKVLLLIVSGQEEATITEIETISNYIHNLAGKTVDIILGVGEDKSLGDQLSVTIIATSISTKVDFVEEYVYDLDDDISPKDIFKESSRAELVLDCPDIPSEKEFFNRIHDKYQSNYKSRNDQFQSEKTILDNLEVGEKLTTESMVNDNSSVVFEKELLTKTDNSSNGLNEYAVESEELHEEKDIQDTIQSREANQTEDSADECSDDNSSETYSESLVKNTVGLGVVGENLEDVNPEFTFEDELVFVSRDELENGGLGSTESSENEYHFQDTSLRKSPEVQLRKVRRLLE